MHAPVAICTIYGPEFIVELANEYYLEIIKKDNNIIGRPVFESLPAFRKQAIKERLESVLLTGTTYFGYELELEIDSKQGFYNLVFQRIAEPARSIKGINVLITDVTEQVIARKQNLQNYQHHEKELEENVQQRTIELKEANELFQDKNTELVKLNLKLESFTYISSHDLQEPLRKIQTFTSRLLEEEYETLSTKGKDYLGRLHKSATRMQMLIEDLLAYSYSNSKTFTIEKVNLDSLVQQVREDLSDLLQAKKGVIESENLGEAEMNTSQILQVMINLVSNALKFSKSGIPPVITITSSIEKGTYLEAQKANRENGTSTDSHFSPVDYRHLQFTDNGIGFDPIYKEKIFEVFQRLHGKEEYAGTGIGLAIVKKIVENHNGIITANGELNKGATFDIYIFRWRIKTIQFRV